MHELAIAEAIVAIASRHADGRAVARVEVKVGHLRQVVPGALEFAFQVTTQGTELEGAELAIEVVPAIGRCRTCGIDARLDGFPLRCHACGGLDLELLSGEELLVDAMELEEALTTTGGTGDGC